MENIKLKEDKLNKLKASKYKSAYNKKLLLKSLKIGICFAIIMIIIRCLALWILSFNSELPYKELITSKYYYGNESGNLFKYVDSLLYKLWGFLYPNSFNIVIETGGLGLFDWILVIICYIHEILLTIMFLGAYIIFPIVYFIIKVIYVVDSIIPVTIGVFYGWFLYLTLFATLATFIVKVRGSKRNLTNLDEYVNDLTLRNMFTGLLILTIMLTLIGSNFVGSTKKSDEFKDIRNLTIIKDKE